ncbi:MAG: VWA domain-containing protein, partial [Chloroflexi bacterium]|nr:VWA domain-containing protein [Chloroflexota bacterium]
ATLRQVAGDLAGVEGPKVVVLVTDGEETCKGDPAAEVAALVARGLDVQVNIVAFAIDDEQLQADIASWAAIGNGTSFQADDATELGAAIAKALSAPFRVYDEAGRLVASGIVGGPSVPVPVGTYRVEILTDPLASFETVVVASGAYVDLVLGAPAP